jgi:hypothetical protein
MDSVVSVLTILFLYYALHVKSCRDDECVGVERARVASCCSVLFTLCFCMEKWLAEDRLEVYVFEKKTKQNETE